MNPEGETQQDIARWRWAAGDSDFQASLENSSFFQGEFDLHVNVPTSPLKEQLAVEIWDGIESRKQVDPTLINHEYGQGQFYFRLTRSQLEHVASSSDGFYLVGVDTGGHPIRSLKLDKNILMRGEAAMSSARTQAAEMKLDYRNRCTPTYEANEGIVLT